MKSESSSARMLVSSSGASRDSIVTRGAATRKKTWESEPSSSSTSTVTSIRGRLLLCERRVVERLGTHAEDDALDAGRGPARRGRAGRETARTTIASPSTVASTRFIDGEPMKAATKRSRGAW